MSEKIRGKITMMNILKENHHYRMKRINMNDSMYHEENAMFKQLEKMIINYFS